VGCNQAGVVRIRYGGPTVPTRGERGADTRSPENGSAAGFAETARAELIEYFRGERRVFDVPVDWSPTDSPRRQVLTVLAETVGYGETISYGALARRAGLPAEPTAARDVGTIMASNPIPLIVPCHRVLASDGLGGYSGGAGLEVKRWLLILEGSHPPTLDWQPMIAG
jgi:methylated-DNA-[protein]-cysteine S-methyltransferase